ncbi:MAG: TolC family protein [Deltaproteobacteria bacterium]
MQTKTTPRAGRCFRRPAPVALLLAVLPVVVLRGSDGRAQQQEVGADAPAGVVLDRDTVIALARRQAPDVRTARVRIGESTALHIGARAWATFNPEIGLSAGPRWGPISGWFPDVTVSLVWPLDVTGAPAARWRFADAATREANALADEASWIAAAEALDLWVLALGAQARVQLEHERAALDASLLRIAEARRNAGAVGDGDVALATVVRAEAQARVQIAEGELNALSEQLRVRLGMGPGTMALSGTLAVGDAPRLEDLVAGLARRRDVVRAGEAIETARGDLELQRRLGGIVPRLTVFGGRDSEYFLRGGIDVPIPVYQRNQTRVAVAGARIETTGAERAAVRARAEGELRAAYARYLGTRAAAAALGAARTAIDDAERLAMRGYELGQHDLASAVLVRREASLARTADLEARIALARARVAVDRTAGVLP